MLDAVSSQQAAAARVANRRNAPSHAPPPCRQCSDVGLSSDDPSHNKCAQCATVRVVPCDISARSPPHCLLPAALSLLATIRQL